MLNLIGQPTSRCRTLAPRSSASATMVVAAGYARATIAKR